MRMKHDASHKLEALAAEIEFITYCEAHPGSPCAVRRPTVSYRGAVWLALLGQNLQDGVYGLGNTLSAALADFDRQYLSLLHPQAPESTKPSQNGLIEETLESKRETPAPRLALEKTEDCICRNSPLP